MNTTAADLNGVKTLGDLIDKYGGEIKTGPFGTKLKASEYTISGVPVISVGEVGYGRIRLRHDTPLVDESVYLRMPEYLLEPGDIVFGRKGSVERSAQVQESERGYFLGSDGIRVRLNHNECVPRFIAYQLQTSRHKGWMMQHAAGSTMPSLNEGIIRRIPIVWKSLDEQKRIAHILGTLDDKIELNRKMSATLEEMARALFKSWFIDFDPVHAKAEGRPTDLPSEIDVLFPDSLQESMMGMIPSGWAARAIHDILEINPPRKLAKGQISAYLDMSNTPTQGQSPTKTISREFTSGTKFINGDTLLARITPCLENGKAAYVDFLQNGEVGWGSTEFIVFQPKDPFPREYAYLLARHDKLKEFAIQSMSGSSGRQRVQVEALSRFETVEPARTILDLFGSIVSPLLLRARQADKESRTLSDLRDLLLPRIFQRDLNILEQDE